MNGVQSCNVRNSLVYTCRPDLINSVQ